jgi:plasmid stability protein
MPLDLHEWLTKRAESNDRSMNAELIRILKEAKEAEKRQEAKAA